MRRFTWLGALVSLVACQTTSPDGIDNFDAWVDPSSVIPDGGAADHCSLDRSYEFFRDGGRRLFQDRSMLLPPRTHRLTRERRGEMPQSCVHNLSCDAAAPLVKALAQRDVVEAMMMAAKPHYGSDPRPADGTIFVFQRDDGHGFSVGPGAVPVGVRALEEMLLKVEMESRETPACFAALR